MKTLYNVNSPLSIYENSNMTPKLSGHLSIYGLISLAQVSSGNCEVVESWKICNFDPKTSESC